MCDEYAENFCQKGICYNTVLHRESKEKASTENEKFRNAKVWDFGRKSENYSIQNKNKHKT